MIRDQKCSQVFSCSVLARIVNWGNNSSCVSFLFYYLHRVVFFEALFSVSHREPKYNSFSTVLFISTFQS